MSITKFSSQMETENVMLSYLFIEYVMSWKMTLCHWASISRRFVGI
jgi:hypothetical protein